MIAIFVVALATLLLIVIMGGNAGSWVISSQQTDRVAPRGMESVSCTLQVFTSTAGAPAARSKVRQSTRLGTPGQDVGAFVNSLISSNETICFEAGDYVLTSGMRVVGMNNVTFRPSPGAEFGTRIPLRLLQIVNSTNVVVIGGRWIGPGYGVFPDIEIDRGSNHIVIEGVDASSAGHDGILIRNDTLPDLRVSILNNFLHNNGRYGFQDFEATPSNGLEILVSGNRAEDNVVGGIYTNGVGGARIIGNTVTTTGGNMRGLIGIGVTNGENDEVVGNRVDHMFWYGIQVFYNNHTLVANNYASYNSGDSDQSGITNDHSFYDTIVNNTVESNGLAGIHVERSWYVNVTSNIARNNGRFGIEFYHGDMPVVAYGLVSSNVCSQNGQAGIILNSGTHFDIVGNRCFDNAGSGILLYNDQGEAGSSGNRITGNRLGNNGSSTLRQDYGIREMNQADHNVISANLLVRNAVTNILLVGTASSVSANLEES